MAILHYPRVPLNRGALALALPAILCACSKPGMPVEVSFQPRYGDSAISCTEGVEGLQLSDLRLYVYDLKLTDQAGKEQPIQLDADGVWQDGTIALLDFENGQGACVNGSEQSNNSVRGQVSGGEPVGSFRGISFTVGVPPESNHGDPLMAGAPLNYTPMHWHWLSGYKFMRAGVAGASDHFWMHLGSTRCDGSIKEGIQCQTANRVAVTLSDFDPRRDRIVIDLLHLTEGVDLDDGTGSDCSSEPDELTCGAAFATLGLPFGAATDAPPQRVFRGERAP